MISRYLHIQNSEEWEDYEKEMNEKFPGISKRKDFKYPPILPIVYYEGKQRWTASLDIADKILCKELLGEYLPHFRYQLVRLHDYSNKELLEKEDCFILTERNGKMNPGVSIVLPTYNGKKYIRESVDSILAQSYTDWELILVDDCSTDGTAEILEEYATGDKRISVIHNMVNQKLPRSLNTGFSRARGRYLTWTSDDNRYMPEALEKMVGFLEENENAMIVRSDYFFIDAQGEVIGNSIEYSDHNMYAFNCFGACFLYRKEVRDVVGEYNTDAFGVEDYEYWLRILDRFGRIFSIDERLYEYRRHGESLSESKRQMVLNQLAELRRRYEDKMLGELKNDKAELCRIYYEMILMEAFGSDIRNDFRKICHELERDQGFTDRKPFIVFGAGIYGGRAVEILGDKAVFFTDNDPQKEGKIKCGREILSFEKAKELSDQYDFLIAVHHCYIYELICQLNKAGIKEYTTLQSYMADMDD